MSFRRIMIGAVLAIMALAGAAAPASAAVRSVAGALEIQEFQGDGIGLRPPAAVTMARADADAQAAAEGFTSTQCRKVSSTLFFDATIYVATVTISCSR
ncbi:hypothetical protein ACWENQ_15935 [Nonomuraea sp. NPDC004354]